MRLLIPLFSPAPGPCAGLTRLLALAESDYDMGKRDLTCNINFFMNVPVTPAGGLTFEDGISDAGKYVELRAEMEELANELMVDIELEE